MDILNSRRRWSAVWGKGLAGDVDNGAFLIVLWIANTVKAIVDGFEWGSFGGLVLGLGLKL
jgi:hypothetical protein